MAQAKKTMTAEHKAALAEGRSAARAIKGYLEALEANKPKRGRKRTPDSIRKRLDAIAETIADAAALKRVQLIQERLDLEAELAQLESGKSVDLSQLEADFVDHAKAYSGNKGITYAAWRESGIEPRVLKAAGVSR